MPFFPFPLFPFAFSPFPPDNDFLALVSKTACVFTADAHGMAAEGDWTRRRLATLGAALGAAPGETATLEAALEAPAAEAKAAHGRGKGAKRKGPPAPAAPETKIVAKAKAMTDGDDPVFDC